MPDLSATMRADQIGARKAADKDRTLLLGTVLAALKNREIEVGHTLADVEVVEVLRKQIKQRQDSVEQFTAAQRLDLAAREASEITILQAYLPPDLDIAVLRTAAQEAVAAGATDLGRLMGALMGQFKGQADGKVINQVAREALQQK